MGYLPYLLLTFEVNGGKLILALFYYPDKRAYIITVTTVITRQNEGKRKRMVDK